MITSIRFHFFLVKDRLTIITSTLTNFKNILEYIDKADIK